MTGWQTDALCATTGHDPNIFFPTKGSVQHVHIREAKAICADCPVTASCLKAHLKERIGIFGGTTAKERRILNQKARETAPRRTRRHTPECGTDSGYRHHHKHGTPVCEDCRVAHNKATKLARTAA